MLRRILPLAVSAAALALVPTSALAAPTARPIGHVVGDGYFGTATFELADGRFASVSLSRWEMRGGAQVRGALLWVETWSTYECTGAETCETPHIYGSVELSPDQVRLDRSLKAASVTGVDLLFTDPMYWDPSDRQGDPGWGLELPPDEELPPSDGEWTDPGDIEVPPTDGGELPPDGEWTDPADGELPPWDGEYPPAFEYVPQPPQTLTVSMTLTGTGTVDRSAAHGTICGDGERECQAMRLYAQRPATASLTVGEVAGTGSGQLAYGQYVDAAIPQFKVTPQ